MKKILYLLLVVLFSSFFLQTNAQYNNEWIVPGKNYYKFKIGETALYRLNNSFLTSIGLGSVDKSQLQLWRNGKQIPLYATTEYIEFWGEQNDGFTDEQLFQNPAQQLDKRKSLHTDSATLFLTVNSNVAQNLKFVSEINNVAGRPASVTAEPYFIHSYYLNNGTTFNYGPYSRFISEPVYDSRYFYKSFGWQLTPSSPYNLNFNNLYAYSGGVASKLTLSITGLSYVGGNRTIRATSNIGGELATAQLLGLESKFITSNPTISGDFTLSVKDEPATTNSNYASDRVMLNYAELEYPRTFNFGGANKFAFILEGNGQAKYLEINNFNANGSVPVLYDLTNRKRYQAVVAGSTLQFYLPMVNGKTNFVLTEQSTNGYKTIDAVKVVTRNYPNYNDAANQTAYAIISNKGLYGEGNYVQQYADYRSSAEGGGFNAKVYDIDVLEDMFAFGIKGHPLSIKNFIKFGRDKFSVKPQYVFIIGRGLPFYQNKLQQGNAVYQDMNYVPTYGYPGSDIMLAADGLIPVPAVNIGRISAVQPSEIKIYLDKIKQYETSQKFTSYTIADNLWKKNIIFATGGSNIHEWQLFNNYIFSYSRILTDTLMGGNGYLFTKFNTGSVSGNYSSEYLKPLLANGVRLISYYGHGASTTLGFQELSTPLPYTFNGKYPIFITSGCDVGDYFSYISGRRTNLNNIPESYIFTKDKGSVAFVAQSYLGVTSYLHRYNQTFYDKLGVELYGRPLFESMKAASESLTIDARNPGVDTICYYSHAAQTNLLGDPFIKVHYAPKPDFVIEENQINAPSSVSFTEDRFRIKAYLHNIGMAKGDSVNVEITRKLPSGQVELLLNKNIKSIRNIDSIEVDVPLNLADKYIGINEFTISIDKDNKYDELSEANNQATKRVTVFSDGVTLVYPYKYGIIENATAKLVASTSDPLAASKQYVMELDTTELFNSSSKITKTITSKGGALEFDPGISYTNERVYYWRVSSVASNSDDYRWSNSSFQYLTGKGEGFGQAHSYQHLHSDLNNINIDSSNGQFEYRTLNIPVQINHAIVGGGNASGWSDFVLNVNGKVLSHYYCNYIRNSLLFNILDPNSLQPYYNQAIPSTTQNPPFSGFMGSVAACGTVSTAYDRDPKSDRNKSNFQFPYNTKADRDKIKDFIDWIPEGAYVVMRLFIETPFENVPLIDTWKQDGSNSLYESLMSQNLSLLNDFVFPRAGVFIFKKNDDSYSPLQELTNGAFGKIQRPDIILEGRDSIGVITSPKFGPAHSWKKIEWTGNSEETTLGDNININVIGYTAQGDSSVLLTLNRDQNSYDISGINASQYPYLKLKMENKDAVTNTPYQLHSWRLLSVPLPEGGLAPNISFSAPDTISQGQDIKLSVAFKNVSGQTFSDSLVNKITLVDANNVSYSIPVNKFKKLAPGESQIIEFTIPGDTAAYNSQIADSSMRMPVSTKDLSGKITIGVDINPGLQTPEYTHDNNILYKTVLSMKENSVTDMDVTFDGMHILDNDIVSSIPKINIRLRDESKHILVKDTSSVKVTLRYPSGALKYFNYNSDTLQFFAAQNPEKNEALVDFKPFLTEDGTYQLSITGLNASNPNSTPVNYSVSFQVYNKPMISDMFNYPNPFTTSTAFVFTLTGSQVPQNLRIQILTVTGKIVKEITKQELGNITIGRNITEYKWDGTDQYGQPLANGVYLYRVITNQDGKKLDKFEIKDANGNNINTSQYFNKGYGKMYLMR